MNDDTNAKDNNYTTETLTITAEKVNILPQQHVSVLTTTKPEPEQCDENCINKTSLCHQGCKHAKYSENDVATLKVAPPPPPTQQQQLSPTSTRLNHHCTTGSSIIGSHPSLSIASDSISVSDQVVVQVESAEKFDGSGDTSNNVTTTTSTQPQTVALSLQQQHHQRLELEDEEAPLDNYRLATLPLQEQDKVDVEEVQSSNDTSQLDSPRSELSDRKPAAVTSTDKVKPNMSISKSNNAEAAATDNSSGSKNKDGKSQQNHNNKKHDKDGEEVQVHKKKRRSALQQGQSAGRWTDDEHQAFLIGLQTYGREWKKVAEHIPTRTSAQVRSHAQKYFAKLQREDDLTVAPQRDYKDSPLTASPAVNAATSTPAIKSNITRTLAQPEAVQAEVEDTLHRLRIRYRQLQNRLQAIENGEAHDENGVHPVDGAAPNNNNRRNGDGQASRRKRSRDDMSSATSLSSLQNEELIALSVLHGALRRGNNDSSSTTTHSDKSSNNDAVM